jgi:hypothetical protein
MSGRGKRIWAPRLDFNAAYHETLRFFKRAQEHNILSKPPVTLYQAFLAEGAWPVDGMDEISRYLRFGHDNLPQTDRGRQAAARLLAVAVKAHFFLDSEAVVTHEPYLFVMPDLASPGQQRYGLVYPLERKGQPHTLLVADWDLSAVSSRLARLSAAQRFPTVLTDNPYQWLQISRWRTLRKEAEQSPWHVSSPGARQKVIRDARGWPERASFAFGKLLTYPMDLNPDVQAAGGLWAPGVKSWFLPTGFDVDAVKAFLDAQQARTPLERHALRWWSFNRAPKDPADDHE